MSLLEPIPKEKIFLTVMGDAPQYERRRDQVGYYLENKCKECRGATVHEYVMRGFQLVEYVSNESRDPRCECSEFTPKGD